MTPIYGLDLFGNPIEPARPSLLAERFFVPPFSVLNAREGWWQDRKWAWIAQGIKGEVGREAVGKSSWNDLSLNPRAAESTAKIAAVGDGPTIFDPVLTELTYRWFCPPSGQIIDPFAGGSVRGIVASVLGYRYWGCDLRPEQIAANEEQAARITPDNPPVWVCGDALDEAQNAPAADFVFSCPPYLNLERYSDDPRDLSTMADLQFLDVYGRIIGACIQKLHADRFACFVVGDVRAQSGYYRNFVSDTIAAFQLAGAMLYNEAILVTQVGSLPIRVTKQFEVSRKLGKTHQNVLVFCKGNPKRAVQALSEKEGNAA